MTWRAIYCNYRQELVARSELALLGVEAFCPYERFKRHFKVNNATQVRYINLAMFPNYIFANIDNFYLLDSVKGVIGPVNVGRRPLAVPEKIVSTMRALADPDGLVHWTDMTKHSFAFKGKVGERFTVKPRNPLHGFILCISDISRLDETGEIAAFVNMFGRETEVRLDFRSVEKILAEV